MSTAPNFASVGTPLAYDVGTSAAVPIPSGVTTDDIVLVHLWIEGSETVTAPAGFTEAPDSPALHATGPNYLHIFWKRQTSATGAGETTGTYSFTFSSVFYAGYATRYGGCVTSGSPFDVTTSAASDAATADSPAVSDTTTVDNTLLVWSIADYLNNNYSAPTGFTERADFGATTVTGMACDDKVQAAAGATGSITATGGSGGSKVVWLGALKPVAELEGPGMLRWNGSAWVATAAPKRWDGDSWELVPEASLP